MKKYNTPEFNKVTLYSADCITLSGLFGAISSGSGDEWDWSKSVDNEAGFN